MTAFLRIAGDYTGWNVYRKSVVICDVTKVASTLLFSYIHL